ncbi:hypothetical protein CUC43_34285 (plasmid) [Bacillus thuringiensis LM1212]|uniref:hypothetical protein n=1 Tax=Bacillus cereus group TaxID=86661 RepID=UPI00042A60B4|nr:MULTISPECIES: hypothetical protein [Bacillus cereus group]AXY11621.1 hypothetical protein CUC43_34285 [Bacillus thuringiensis LM1212]QDF27474.1 hypothetical protein FJR70_32630 [Bacillus tropicus]QUG99356.1 hypothetical protein HCM98_31595 [Bacillus tropicus]
MGEVIEIEKQKDRRIELFIEGKFTRQEFVNYFDSLARFFEGEYEGKGKEKIDEFIKAYKPKKVRRHQGKPHGNKRKEQILKVLRGGLE